MALKTRCKLPSWDGDIDVSFERVEGVSKNINDRNTYKLVFIYNGSLVVEDGDKYRILTAPAGMILNENAQVKVLSEYNVKTATVFFKPTVIRDEFTFDAINSGKYEKFLSAVAGGDKLTNKEKYEKAIAGRLKLEKEFSDATIYQDALYLLPFITGGDNGMYYEMSALERDNMYRLVGSIEYELEVQPDNFWLFRIRHFLVNILFVVTADFFHNSRENEVYKDYLVVKAMQYMRKHLEEEISLADIVNEVSVNKNKLNEAFLNEVGMTCMAYLEHMRMQYAKLLLNETGFSIKEICERIGYFDVNYFSKVFKKNFGMSPTEYRKGKK